MNPLYKFYKWQRGYIRKLDKQIKPYQAKTTTEK